MKKYIITISIITFLLCLWLASCVEGVEISDKLWMGLVAEDTGGSLDTYRAIASVCRNRLKNGLSVGLVALNRQGLTAFVQCNRAYVMAKRGVDLKTMATLAIQEVFGQGKDYANSADHYEHTGHYPEPSWAQNKKVMKVLYPNTKREITFWR